MAPSHGLTAVGWNNTPSKGLDELGKIQVRSEGGGTFSQLIELQNKHEVDLGDLSFRYNYMPIILSNIRWQNKFIITLDDILSRTPQLMSIYLQITGNYPRLRQAQVAWQTNDMCDIKNIGDTFALATYNPYGTSNKDYEELERYFNFPPLLETTTIGNFCGNNRHHFNAVYKYRIKDSSDFNFLFLACEDMEHIAFNPDKKSYLVYPLEDGTVISKTSRMYCLAYFLGMLVRYNPTAWSSLITKRSGDRYLPLLKSATDMIESEYPKLMLRMLRGYSF